MVFSTTLTETTWKDTKLYHKIDPEEVKSWKQWDGKDIAIFGSGSIVQQFAKLGLIDEYRILVNPVVLGKGKPLFTDYMKLNLADTRKFGNGNVLLTYTPIQEERI